MKKDIIALIDCLDNFLEKTNRQNIDPVEGNAILAKAGLLTDSKDRPGKPLRDLLRKGFLPHAFQPGGKGSSWTIPHSGKHSIKAFATTAAKPKLSKSEPATNLKQVSISNGSQIELTLLDERKYQSAGTIDDSVSHRPGLYAIRINDINILPKPFSTYLKERHHNIIYIGIASQSLHKRFLNQELRGNGQGTFFRSMGAVLGYRPLKGSLVKKANKRNFKFAEVDEQKIIKWINNYLIVNWVEFNSNLGTIETVLIKKYRPLLNLAKNPSALPLLSELRKGCAEIANEQ